MQEVQETMMAKIKTQLWDASDHLKTDDDIVAYLEAALDDGDPHLIAAVLEDIVRAKINSCG